jgi:hypothetical protein
VNDRPLRIEGFLEQAALADPDLALLRAAADDHFGPVAAEFRTLSLKPGEALPEVLPQGAAGGLLLDLGPPDWRSEWGGLLLFLGEKGALHGYRPVPGALTLFRAAHEPLISLITSQGMTRTSILGWWS